MVVKNTMSNHYEVPNWAGKPPVGLHLDVMKVDRLIQKLMIDEKRCYLFGRNSQMNDFCIDHASCSRVHAALVYHKILNRPFLVDLGSTHGTFIGSLRIEGYKPTQLPIDSNFHFGASTRMYVIRERPQAGIRPIIDEIEKASHDGEGGLLGLPETETELDNLTEFNTAHNRRISMLGISDDTEKRNSNNRKRKKKGVSFNEDDEIINPEDVDPSVGKFRNLIHSTVVPATLKRQKMSDNLGLMEFKLPRSIHSVVPQLYQDLPEESSSSSFSATGIYSTLSSKLGMILPNPAPEVNVERSYDHQTPAFVPPQVKSVDSIEPRKKKYAKESWPGKKPTQSLLV